LLVKSKMLDFCVPWLKRATTTDMIIDCTRNQNPSKWTDFHMKLERKAPTSRRMYQVTDNFSDFSVLARRVAGRYRRLNTLMTHTSQGNGVLLNHYPSMVSPSHLIASDTRWDHLLLLCNATLLVSSATLLVKANAPPMPLHLLVLLGSLFQLSLLLFSGTIVVNSDLLAKLGVDVFLLYY
jgi:hypothetical protein